MFRLWKLLFLFTLFGFSAMAQEIKVTQLPVAAVGSPYKALLNLNASGTFPFHLAITAGTLPNGLNLTPEGIVQGVPTVSSAQLFIVTITDAAGVSQARQFEITARVLKSGTNESTPVEQGKNGLKSDLKNRDFNDNDESFQIVGGVEQAGIASLPNQTNAFLSAFTRAGVEGPVKAWGRIRLLGAPTASTGGVISAFQDPSGQIKNLDTQKVGQAVDFVVGPDIQIKKLTSSNGRYSMHIIGGIGATTPLSSEDVVNKFKVPGKSSPMCADVLARFTPQNGYPANLILPNTDPTSANCLANGITVLAFNRQERSSFLRKYGFGIRTIDRFKFSSTDEAGNKISNLCCERGIVDFTFGQDESITGGHLHGWVFRIDGTHPLPIAGKSFLYLFGTAAIRIAHNADFRTLILDADNSGATPSAANVALLPLKQPDKDFYRFGVGLDFIKMIKAMTPQKSTTNQPPNQNPPSGGS